MVIPLLANQNLTPMLGRLGFVSKVCCLIVLFLFFLFLFSFSFSFSFFLNFAVSITLV